MPASTWTTPAPVPSSTTSTTFTTPVGTTTTTTTLPPSICPYNVMVIEICTPGSWSNDDFNVYLNGTMIGSLALSANPKAGSIFIGAPETSLFEIVDTTSSCPLSNMSVYYFDSYAINIGTDNNTLLLQNTATNSLTGNLGDISIKRYTIEGPTLIDPTIISDLSYSGLSGVSFTLSGILIQCSPTTTTTTTTTTGTLPPIRIPTTTPLPVDVFTEPTTQPPPTPTTTRARRRTTLTTPLPTRSPVNVNACVNHNCNYLNF